MKTDRPPDFPRRRPSPHSGASWSGVARRIVAGTRGPPGQRAGRDAADGFLTALGETRSEAMAAKDRERAVPVRDRQALPFVSPTNEQRIPKKNLARMCRWAMQGAPSRQATTDCEPSRGGSNWVGSFENKSGRCFEAEDIAPLDAPALSDQMPWMDRRHRTQTNNSAPTSPAVARHRSNEAGGGLEGRTGGSHHCRCGLRRSRSALRAAVGRGPLGRRPHGRQQKQQAAAHAGNALARAPTT
jgi:hypothetical protein